MVEHFYFALVEWGVVRKNRERHYFPLAPLEHHAKLAILQLLEDRYGRKSTIITSQLSINKWHQYINEPTIADAIMDRLSGSAHRIELKGESLRNKNI